MASLNKVQLIGNVGQDPEIVTFKSGDKVAKFTLATTEKWKGKNGKEDGERTEWHRVEVYGGTAEVIENYVQKGKQLYIEGQLQTDKWEDKDGKDRYTTKVVVRGWGGKVILLGSSGGAAKKESPKAKQQSSEDDELF